MHRRLETTGMCWPNESSRDDVSSAKRSRVASSGADVSHLAKDYSASLPLDLIRFIMMLLPTRLRISVTSFVCKRWRSAALATISYLQLSAASKGTHSQALSLFSRLSHLDIQDYTSDTPLPGSLTGLQYFAAQCNCASLLGLSGLTSISLSVCDMCEDWVKALENNATSLTTLELVPTPEDHFAMLPYNLLLSKLSRLSFRWPSLGVKLLGTDNNISVLSDPQRLAIHGLIHAHRLQLTHLHLHLRVLRLCGLFTENFPLLTDLSVHSFGLANCCLTEIGTCAVNLRTVHLSASTVSSSVFAALGKKLRTLEAIYPMSLSAVDLVNCSNVKSLSVICPSGEWRPIAGQLTQVVTWPLLFDHRTAFMECTELQSMTLQIRREVTTLPLTFMHLPFGVRSLYVDFVGDWILSEILSVLAHLLRVCDNLQELLVTWKEEKSLLSQTDLRKLDNFFLSTRGKLTRLQWQHAQLEALPDEIFDRHRWLLCTQYLRLCVCGYCLNCTAERC